jgi:hypothetical protein
VTPADGSETPRQTADITLHLRPHRTQPDQPGAAPGSWHLNRGWLDPSSHDRRLPVSGLLQRRNQSLARRQSGDEPLAPELARGTRPDSSAS